MPYKLVIIKNQYKPELYKEMVSSEPFAPILADQVIDWTPWGGDSDRQLKVKAVSHRIEEQSDGGYLRVVTVIADEELTPAAWGPAFVKAFSNQTSAPRPQRRGLDTGGF